MVKILHLLSTFQIKTDAKWLLRLLPKLDRRQFDVAVAAFYGDGPMRHAFEKSNIPCHCLNVRCAWDGRSLSRPVDLIRRLEPDIVHTHLLRADLFGGLAAVMTKTSLVSSVYAHGPYRRARKRCLADALLDRITCRLPDRFLAVCQAIKDDLVQRLGVPEARIDVIHSGVDLIPIDPQARDRTARVYRLPDDRPVLMVPARLSYEKGVACFLRAARMIVARGLNPCCLIAGSGPREKELRTLARELTLSEHVRFLGFVEDVELLMAASDLVVLPSLSEGLPNAALEAFAVGTPLVAAAVGGLIDLSRYDGSALLLAEPNDPRDFADKIIRVLSEPDLGQGMVEAARSMIQQRLNTGEVGRSYERFYLRVCSGRP